MKSILWVLVVILLIGWVFGFLVFKVLGGVIHLLLIVAAGLIIYNFLVGKKV